MLLTGSLLDYFFLADFPSGLASGFSSGITNPMGRFFGSGGAMSWRIDSIRPVIAWSCESTMRFRRFSVHVVRAFIELRNLVAGNKELASKLKRLERTVDSHDQAITGLIESMRELMAPPEPKKRPIGFVIPDEKPDAKPGGKSARKK